MGEKFEKESISGQGWDTPQLSSRSRLEWALDLQLLGRYFTLCEAPVCLCFVVSFQVRPDDFGCRP